MVVQTFAQLRARAQELGPRRVGLVVADDEVALRAVENATELNIAIPVLFGDETKIRSTIGHLGAQALLERAVFVVAEDAIERRMRPCGWRATGKSSCC